MKTQKLRRINYSRLCACYHYTCPNGELFQFGWYDSGKVFFALDGAIVPFSEIVARFAPHGKGKLFATPIAAVRFLASFYCGA